MINIVFTGQIRTPKKFKKSITDLIKLRKKNQVNQIILSTWLGELENYKGLRIFLNRNSIDVIESKNLEREHSSFIFQSHSLKIGLQMIKNKSQMIFKSRPDLYIKTEALLKITQLDLKINPNIHSIFKKKVWIPWFEITKPFYLADECFFASYTDMIKLCNYEKIYDHYYKIDAGKTHVRRFIHPFLDKYNIFKEYLKYFSLSSHNTPNRFKILNKLKSNNDYLNFIYLYYFIISNYFHVGLGQKQYIEFRKWNAMQIDLPFNIKKSFNKKYSWDVAKGQIYCDNNTWIKNLDFRYKTNFKFNKFKILKLQKLTIHCNDIQKNNYKKNNFIIKIKYYAKFFLKKIKVYKYRYLSDFSNNEF